MRWLIPRLSDFQDRHPDLPINLSVGGGPFDFERDGVTLAIRRLDFPVDPQWRITTLFPETNGPVMKPDMLKGYRAGAFVGLGSKTRPKAWEQWLGTNASAPRPSEIRFFDHHFLMVEAAAGGLGVAMSPKVLAIDDIRKERLAAPQGFIPDGTSYGLIRPSRAAQATESGIALLMKWLCALAVDLSP